MQIFFFLLIEIHSVTLKFSDYMRRKKKVNKKWVQTSKDRFTLEQNSAQDAGAKTVFCGMI